MIKLFDADNESEVGSINDIQLEQLMENLVEETIDEYSWNLNGSALAGLEANGVDAELVAMLRRALGNRTSMELRYEPD